MKFDTDKYNTYEIIAFGRISVPGIGESRFIPFVTLHKSSFEVAELIDIHYDTPPGDIETTWTRPISLFKPKNLILKMSFTNPQHLTFGIKFDINKHNDIIDGLLISQALYLDTGEFGDKFMIAKNKKIIIEVPRMSFQNTWNKLQFNFYKDILKKKGINKKEINKSVNELIKTNREIWQLRGK